MSSKNTLTSTLIPRVHALVPCGGTGTRAGTGIPKQYRQVAGQSVLAHSLAALGAVSRLAQIVVVVSAEDELIEEQPNIAWRAHRSESPYRLARCAGPTRAHTVGNGLAWLQEHGAEPNDWVLVHDAARCLVTPTQINQLIDACLHDPVGGLLAHKLPDTLKAGANGRVVHTVPREDKWLAQTPQMFRVKDLTQAMDAARESDYAHITDEASAMEAIGLAPLLVEGGAQNFKLTYAADFALAEAVLQARAGLATLNSNSD